MIKLLIVAFSFFSPQATRDSVGIETINGKVFVIHKVGEKETLYGISKRYGTTVDDILKYNPTADAGLEVGKILKVPYTPKTTTKANTGGGLVHVVTDKETLFSISKAYNVSVDELKQWNNLTSNSLTLGQELTIKKRNTNSASAVTNTQTQVAPPNNTQTKSKISVHTVAAKETMFSISRQYGITVQQLKDWNNLQSNEISIGQTLVVAEPERGAVAQTQTTTQAVTQPVVTTTTSAVTTTPVKQPDAEPVKTIVKEPVTVTKEKEVVAPPKEKETIITISEAVKGSDEVMESGVAELIEGTDGNRKYLALHRTAPVGTILKVRNEMNNREVFVRVMGKLPETVLTDKVIIRVSKSAYDRLGAIDQRFRVQVTYYK